MSGHVKRLREALEHIADWKKHGWIADISDIARAALFLASDNAGYITGQTIIVDGGKQFI